MKHMPKQSSIDYILSIIDRIQQKVGIDNKAQFSLFARELIQSLLNRSSDATEEQHIDNIVTWGWSLVQQYNGSPNIAFHDVQSEDGSYTFLLLNMTDLPFIVDTVRITVSDCAIPIMKFYNVAELLLPRDPKGALVSIVPPDSTQEKELLTIFRLSKISDEEKNQLEEALIAVLKDVRFAVDDWPNMQALMMEVIETWVHASKSSTKAKRYQSVLDFMEWMHRYYTYLGARCYSLSGEGNARSLKRDRKHALGVMKSKRFDGIKQSVYQEKQLANMGQNVENNLFYITKSTMKCGIHRDVYADLFVLRMLDNAGAIIGEVRFVGLLSSEAYDADPSKIPWIGDKINDVVAQAKIKSRYSNKSLTHILKNIPTDELFQCTVSELKKNALAQLAVKGLRETRAIIRRDIISSFYTLTILMPRDYYNYYVATKIRKLVTQVFSSEVVDWMSNFSDVDQVSMYLTINYNPDIKITEAVARSIEEKITAIATPWWDSVMMAYRSDKAGVDFNTVMAYRDFFGSKYRSKYRGIEVIHDIKNLEAMKDQNDADMLIKFSKAPEHYQQAQASWSLKIYQVNSEIILSDILPILENIGLSVVRENSVQLSDIHDVKRVYSIIDLHINPLNARVALTEARAIQVIACVKSVLGKSAHSDIVNLLLTTADVSFESLIIIRALIYYAKQTNFMLSTEFMLQTVVMYPMLTALLIDIFQAKFGAADNQSDIQTFIEKYEIELEQVDSINEDKVYRRLLNTIQATVRTNFFLPDQSALVLKIQPNLISDMPLPVPLVEAFVYSHRFAGTHLRMSLISRGGIRWSDRLEDYRTEVLGLMHAQQLKNAVIVPDGAKGVYVPKLLTEQMSKDEYYAEGQACYQLFVESILSICDNYTRGEVKRANGLKVYDDDDTYFVVAADKGTATFSDAANQIAYSKDYWLGDAFASGGKHGYDHKKIGITAKGAWQSVRWHFASLGINPDHDHFTVVGIGDMSGDVFGNGMLLSKHISLVAAFDHRHIFIDPHPDRKRSFQERKRLFKLSRSSWEDYNQNLISSGGGVFSRSEKYIHLTDTIQEFFGIEDKMITPCELIQRLLAADVDLIWNGGIGTYIRASTETNADVQDIANDGCRIDASQLRARVIAEGGNLGITQRARVEYALNGGLINTDFIDNVGGVACSDIEVNLKIGLSHLESEGEISSDGRNALLNTLQPDVKTMILQSITKQNFSLSAAERQSATSLEIYIRYIKYLEKAGISNAAVDKLPAERELLARQTNGKTLVRSELAILYAHTKTLLVRELLKKSLVDDPYCLLYLYHAFPEEMAKKYSASLMQHALRREIIATEISDVCINDMGLTFIQQIYDETRCTPERAVKAYFISLEIFQLRPALNFIVEKMYEVDAVIALSLFGHIRQLLRDASWWLVQNVDLDSGDSIKTIADIFTVPVEIMCKSVAQYADEAQQEFIITQQRVLEQAGASEKVASSIMLAKHCGSLLNIVWSLKNTTGRIERFMHVYYWLGKHWHIDWLRMQVENYQVDTIWAQMGRSAALTNIDKCHRSLVNSIFTQLKAYRLSDIEHGLTKIMSRHQDAYDDWADSVTHMQAMPRLSYAVFSVGIMRLEKLSESLYADMVHTN